MRIAMIGTGYVGLVSGACLADFGHHVVCVDKDTAKILALQRCEIPFFEPGLEELVRNNVRDSRLSFSIDFKEAVGSADAVFIAVGTPSRREDGHADLSYVYEAAREIAATMIDFTVVIVKSTVPVGTCDEIRRIIHHERPQADVAVVSNPEFLREGAAIRDFKFPDRIVVGCDDERAKKVLADIYRPLSLNQVPIFYTSRRLEIVAKSLPTPLRRSAPPTKRGITERCQTGPFTPVIKPADSQLAYIVSCCAYLLECFPSRLTEVEITI